MALLFALGTLSCGPADQQSSSEVLADQDLTIVQTSVVYKRSEAIYLANQMEGIYTRAYKLINRQPLDPALQEEVNLYIHKNVLPMLQSLNITKEELKQLIYYTNFLLTTAERSSAVISKKLLEETYDNCIRVIGSDQCGKILYRSCLLYLEHELSQKEELYAQTNDHQTGQEIQTLRNKKQELTDILGESSFAGAASVFYFITSLLDDSYGHGQSSQGQPQLPTLTNEELLLLWQRQEKHLRSLALSDKQWEIACEFFLPLFFRYSKSPFEKNTVANALLQALHSENEVHSGIGKTIPSLITLYGSVIQTADPTAIETLKTGTKTEKFHCINSLLLKNPSEFRSFLLTFSQNIHLDGEKGKKILADHGLWDSFLAYSANRTTITADELYHALANYNQEKSEIPFDAIENYLFESTPYITFVLFHKRSVDT